MQVNAGALFSEGRRVKLSALTIKDNVSNFIPWKANEGGLREIYFAKKCGEMFTHTHFLQIENPNQPGSTTFLGLRENSKRKKEDEEGRDTQF